MATERGDGFLEPVKLIGPFPSGAPAIFIDQAARFGQPAAMIGCVGDDDFGRVNLNRLRRDGVDVSGIRIDPEAATGSAFVRYRTDGSRAFVFNIKQSASGRIAARRGGARRFSIAATICMSWERRSSRLQIVDIVLKAARSGEGARRHDLVRPEPSAGDAESARALREACESLFRRCDLFLPSGPELFLFTAQRTRRRRSPRFSRAASAPSSTSGARKAPAISTPRRGSTQPAIRGRGSRPDRGRRLLRRDLRQLLAARHAAGPMPCLRRRERGARGDAPGPDGRRREPGGPRCLSRGALKEAVVMVAPAPCPRERASDRAASPASTSVCTRASLGHRGGAPCTASARRSARPDRGDLQPGEPGGRLHRHDAGGLPRVSSRRSPPGSASIRRASCWAATTSGPIPGRRCRPRRRWRAPRRWSRRTRARASSRSISTPAWAAPASRPPCRTRSPPSARRGSPRSPRRPDRAQARSSMWSGPKCRSRAASGEDLRCPRHRTGRRPRDDRGAREGVSRARPRGGIRSRRRPCRAARRRVRRIGGHALRSGEARNGCRRLSTICRNSCSRRIRPTTRRAKR